MTTYSMLEAKTNLSKIGKLLSNGEDDYVIVSNNGKPYLKITLYKENSEFMLGILKGKHMFEDEPDWFNDDIKELFDNAEGGNLL
ncbi:MAG: hypothetical protein IJJ19_09150 [Erysipelotrichaceae bacterium]|nr:hypothetical protein [Erysipelotrichaceae bacterium]